jgi:hypothetical protein
MKDEKSIKKNLDVISERVAELFIWRLHCPQETCEREKRNDITGNQVEKL